MTQDLNTELEELLDAELTEEEVAAVDAETTDLEEAEEVGDPSKAADKVKAAKKPSAGGGEKSELKDDSEDLGPAVTSPEDSDSGAGKAADKAKKAKPTKSRISFDISLILFLFSSFLILVFISLALEKRSLVKYSFF